MTDMDDVRWKQRFDNFQKAFQTLVGAVTLSGTRALSDLEAQGMIQGFEFTHELAWCVLKDYLEHKGFTEIVGSRDATRLAFKNGLIEDGDVWMDMIKARNQTSHTYNESVASQIATDITDNFYPAFEKMAEKFTSLYEEEDLPQ
jgi:nucleotidyltransferase substrate binding protein (TIGR01987 family)